MAKLDVLRILEDGKGDYVSGEELAAKLGLSRAAVWKSIRALQEDGYQIESKQGSGYRLEETTDALLESKILEHLHTTRLPVALDLRDTVDSTNTQLRAAAYAGAPEGTVIVADKQTAGKGRLGRSFYSPNRNGVYMSVLLRPNLPFDQIHFLTMLAAVCVVEAVRTVAGVEAQIKWVNDVLVDGKKLCGILNEAAVEGESGRLGFVVMGIGVNVGTTSDFPEMQRNTPGALRDYSSVPFSRCRLIAQILNNLDRYYYPYIETRDSAAFLDTYRRALCLVGRQVTVTRGDESYPALVTGLSDSGGLLVRANDGRTLELTSGEVSIRM
ncbi:biotin--[acetyl-CoA-carboxylase] ligase [Clostridiaceae bacterium NSJ-31]|uniref:Bifunctional ligase/repressor BirA n=2 Tax=Ligaoa zhengdingensis TaxID=2763658 RepID=A0A926DZM6_9FIRM|nr:biotin--[acetyl-CoA-carboxylase] ligase [Ligaoa zhengdingensis]MBC8546504.1 biotin--[acetyl-CoA-carboxylase] ligase [Ligaoa zhengdingensis]